MNACSLPPHVYACHLPQGTVVLDLARNRYFGLGSGPANALKALLSSDSCAAATSEAEQLPQWISRGLLQTSPSPRFFCPTRMDLAAPLIPIEDAPRDPVRPHDIAPIAWHIVAAHAALRRRSLYDIAMRLRAARNRKCSSSAADIERLQVAVGRFRRFRPYVFAIHDRCLLHALALTRYLIGQRLDATWVIGVRLRPWGAHSWSQSGSMVLDTTPEIIREFTPIVAV